MKLFSILLVAVSVSAVSCERHEFEGPNGTKQLNEPHGAAAHGAAAGHEAPAGHEAHPAAAGETGHAEKKAEH